MQITKQRCLIAMLIGAVLMVFGLMAFGWSSNDKQNFEHTFTGGFCGETICKTSSQLDEYLAKYSNDGQMHAWLAYGLTASGIVVVLIGGVALSTLHLKSHRVKK